MPTFSTVNYPRFTDDKEFESLVRDIMALEWNDPSTAKFGRRGQSQKGVDVYGQPVDADGSYRAAQCKLRTTDSRLTEVQIKHEVGEARKFPHALDSLCLVTDAPRDTETQIVVDQISDREVGNGGFRVTVWFWDSICERIAAHPKLIARYYPDHLRQFTTHPALERIIDKPIQVLCHDEGLNSLRDELVDGLKMRGIRCISFARRATEEAVDLDGILFLLDSDERLARKNLLRVSNWLENVVIEGSLIIVLGDDTRHLYDKIVDEYKLDTHQHVLLSAASPSLDLMDSLFEQFFATGYSRRGRIPTINVAARTTEARPRDVLLDIDWRTYLSVDRFPTPEQWNERFIPAMKTVRRVLLEQSDSLRMQFDSHLPLPAAFALGFFFNLRIADVGVWARRNGVGGLKHQLWFANNDGADIQFEPEWVTRPKADALIAVVELTTFVPIETAVGGYLSERELRPDVHVRLPLAVASDITKDIDEVTALAYANRVGQLVRQLAAQGVQDTHIFARVPSALAVLIGQRLLACNRIHLHWYQNPGYCYGITLD